MTAMIVLSFRFDFQYLPFISIKCMWLLSVHHLHKYDAEPLYFITAQPPTRLRGLTIPVLIAVYACFVVFMSVGSTAEVYLPSSLRGNAYVCKHTLSSYIYICGYTCTWIACVDKCCVFVENNALQCGCERVKANFSVTHQIIVSIKRIIVSIKIFKLAFGITSLI